MKRLIYTLFIFVALFSCSSSQSISENDESDNKVSEGDIVRIANDELEYEIIIFDPGFNTWLQSTARPEGYYSQEFLETRNYQYVIAWNQRVLQPNRYNGMYEMMIDYDRNIDYGYEVNYKLYNYFIYFQLMNNQQLTNFIPRI